MVASQIIGRHSVVLCLRIQSSSGDSALPKGADPQYEFENEYTSFTFLGAREVASAFR